MYGNIIIYCILIVKNINLKLAISFNNHKLEF